MRVYLNAGFGQRIGKPTLDWIEWAGFDGCRQDVPWDIPGPRLEELLVELVEAELEACLIVGGWMSYGPNGPTQTFKTGANPPPDEIADFAGEVAIAAQRVGLSSGLELGNEPNLTTDYKDDPERYAEMIRLGAAKIAAVNESIPVCAYNVSGLTIQDRAFLLKAQTCGVPAHVTAAVHPYRVYTEPWQPFEGFASTAEAAQWLRRFSGGNFAISEIGWHTAPQERKKGLFGLFKDRIRFSDAAVAEFAAWELPFWESEGARFYVWYQINDGPDDGSESRFGIRYFEGTNKPAVRSFREYAGLLEGGDDLEPGDAARARRKERKKARRKKRRERKRKERENATDQD